MVQWLKRSPITREVVSSSLNSDLFFCLFSFILLHVLMFNYFKIGMYVICYKMSFSVFLFAVVYSSIVFFFFFFFFGFVLYLFSNFITVLELVKCYPRSVAESSSCINDCTTCPSQSPDPAKVYDPAEDYTPSR